MAERGGSAGVDARLIVDCLALSPQLRGYLNDAGRVPYFCSGCPHNTSTRVPEGSSAIAGVGCHFMATYIFGGTKIFSPMGSEGAAWVGHAPFTATRHIFANMGDGTYFHSGSLALRARRWGSPAAGTPD